MDVLNLQRTDKVLNNEVPMERQKWQKEAKAQESNCGMQKADVVMDRAKV